MKEGLRPVRVTRIDGVATTVWRKEATAASRKLPKLSNSANKQPFTHALEWKPKKVDKPKWWDSFYNESDAQGSQPELMDRLPTDNADIIVAWQPHSTEAVDRSTGKNAGFNIGILYFFDEETGGRLGYIKLSSMTDESFYIAFGGDEYASFRFLNAYRGGGYPMLKEHEVEDSAELRRAVWTRGKRDIDGITSVPDVDDDYIKQDLIRMAWDTQQKIDRQQEDYSPDYPMIDFSNVNAELQGKGLGTALYIYAAKRLALDGAVLRGSAMNNEFSAPVWERLAHHYPDNVHAFEPKDGSTTVSVLDFRA